ncbi:leucine-rich repeat neuronal protein 2-like [Synchiropus splendidus]|uniref:leucine-rich repeat neuronal protein 2-like n=1 Tax=Synchiropus splendidus TaxID=270530 RepID=UPI00237DA1C6|nr:leucine-rich repeat neuronal protein 2-like [Synchiropus splendidus]
MWSTPAPWWQCLLCVLVCVFVRRAVDSLPHALPWHVPCPVRCVCQIKPWFSPDSVYSEAPTVDCNNLLLTSLPSLLPANTHTLRLQSNLLSELDAAVLRRLPNLTDLDLSQNRFSHVKNLTRGPSLPCLLVLHIEENHIGRLPEASFSTLPGLQELFLSHNNINSIVPGAFRGLTSLLRLHINNNRLTVIDPRWFKDLPCLEVLMLGGNPVAALPEKGFVALRSLRSLVLSGMGLKSLAERALEGLNRLESLSFFDNLLTRVPTQALKRVPALKFLDLNKNRIKVLETGDVQNMIHLKELGLNNMVELVSIERAALENLPELTKLEITNNPRLSYIHPEAFLKVRKLESLMLNSNSLSTLQQQVMLSLPSLQEVSLHSNPLHCDCLFRWAAHEASSTHNSSQTDAPRMVRFIQPQATLCSEPAELRGRRVREFSARELSNSCLPMIPASTLPSYVRVREGGHIALHCRALANPPPELYWVTPSGFRLGPAQSMSAAEPALHHSNNLPEGFTNKSASLFCQDSTHNLCKHYKLLPGGSLEISVVTAKEAGLYTCIAENTLGADTRSVTIAVHSRGTKGKRQTDSSWRGFAPRLELVEVKEHFAILTWRSTSNFPSTRLSWQSIPSNIHAPMYTTRILAGTQSFNLSHLQAQTYYRVCLHQGTGERLRPSRRDSRGPQCISFRTSEAAEEKVRPVFVPQLNSAVLLLLMLILLFAAGQRMDSRAAHPPKILVRQVEPLTFRPHTQTHNDHLEEKLLLHPDP